jgi:Rv2258c-like winged HTH domain
MEKGRSKMTGTTDTSTERDALTERLMRATAGTFELYTIYLGDRLGLYRAVAASDAATSAEVARRAGLNERYVREWLEQQGGRGISEQRLALRALVG